MDSQKLLHTISNLESYDIVYSDTKKHVLYPEQVLCLKMIVLAIQDLHLEASFQNLKCFFVVAKARPFQRRHTVTALAWLNKSDYEYSHSFVNCCYAVKLDPAELRSLIFSNIEESGISEVKQCFKEFFLK